ncbi:tetratricopeptide repeat protein [Acidiphilium acidophilum]|uniref:tetratricopeptide repeat protein n=1 Tax=Acidiphilium acidophilum TaxID=76588 RepID=UPI002E8E74D5|nr:tetratricopeptide repeat protein [Acidiphilium acidophilum]
MDDVHAAECLAPPDPFETGLAAFRRGDAPGAIRHFTAVLDDRPDFAPALTNRALAFWTGGYLHEAARDAAAAAAASPDLAEVWLITGAIAIDRGDSAGAIAAYRRAVALRPDLASGHAGLAAAYLAAGQPEAAQQAAALALSLDPACTHARFTLGSARSTLGDPAGAIRLFDQVIAADPAHAGAWLNRGNARINLDDIAGGTADLETAVAVNPAQKEGWASLSVARTIGGDIAGAIAACDRAIALDPDFAVAHWNRGVAALLGGDFATGFTAYEWRKLHPVYGPHFDRLGVPVWRGESLAGRHLLVRAEQGLGDTIMFARFLPHLAAQAARVTLACHPTLFPLFRDLGAALCDINGPMPRDADIGIDQMSLPHVLGLTTETIPAAAGYIAVPSPRPPLDGVRRIGLVWAGNPGHKNDQRRSLPPHAYEPLLRDEELARQGVRFVSLQLGARRGEYDIEDLASAITDYGTTASILAGLEALVTVDTSIAHLAGAMGATCHVLISASCDWRWLLGRDTTPWYDSLSLHRQTRLGDWSAPVAQVRSVLAGADRTW